MIDEIRRRMKFVVNRITRPVIPPLGGLLLAGLGVQRMAEGPNEALTRLIETFAHTRDEHLREQLAVAVFRQMCEITEARHSTMVSRVNFAVRQTGVFRDHNGEEGVMVYKMCIIQEYLRKCSGANKHTAENVCRIALRMGNDGRKIQTLKYPEVIGYRGFHAMSDAFLNPDGDDADLIETRADPEGGSSVQRSPEHMSMMRLTRNIGNLVTMQVLLKRSVGRLQGTMRRLEGDACGAWREH
jgi:hypothetical protein